jgi:hypothetical protein
MNGLRLVQIDSTGNGFGGKLSAAMITRAYNSVITDFI